MRRLKCAMRYLTILFCITSCAFFAVGCSIPSLEKPECTEARETVKQFYSWYFAANAGERDRHPEMFKKYLSPSFDVEAKQGQVDEFVLSDDFPKTFRLGSCKVMGEKEVEIQVQLFWRDDVKTVQKEVHVDTVKLEDKWLIDRVSN